MRRCLSIVISLFVLSVSASTSFAQYDSDYLFQFSKEWQQEVNDTNLDFNLEPDNQIDEQDLLRFVKGWRTGASVPISKVNVVLDLPDDLPGTVNAYSVASLLESASGDQEGSILTVADMDTPSLLMVTNQSDNLVLLGYVLPPSAKSAMISTGLRSSVLRQEGSVEVSAESTALALVMMSPYLLGSTGAQRVEIAGEVVASVTFPFLVQAVNSAISAHPDDPLNAELHPEIYEQAARLMIDILISRSGGGKLNSLLSLEEHQWIVDDLSGNQPEVVIRNPKTTYFGVGFYDPEDDDLQLMGLAHRKGSLVDLFQWPPKFFAQPEETRFAVGDGRYNVSLYKGFNFGSFPIGEVFSYSLPQGRPTLANTAVAILMIFDLVGGFGPGCFSVDSLESLFQVFEDIGEAGLIGEAMSRGDVVGTLSGLVQILGSHQEEIVQWIWKSLGMDGRTKPVRLMKQIGGIFKNVALPLKLISAANEQLPFFWDLVTPPYQLHFHIEQQNGNLITVGEGPWIPQGNEEWIQVAKLTKDESTDDDQFGYAVAISGDTVLVGAPNVPDGGSVSVFVNSGSTWVHQTDLVVDNSEWLGKFGSSVSISGDKAVVGDPNDTEGAESLGDYPGAAYVFARSNSIWTQQAKLKPSTVSINAHFGNAVSISGSTVVVGAEDDDNGAERSGAAYLFTESSGTWTQQAKLSPDTAEVEKNFGHSVSISGDTVVVGDNVWQQSNSAYVFINSADTWSKQATLTADTPVAEDEYGCSLSIEGDTIVIGAPGEGNGSAYLFHRTGTSWSQSAKLTASDGADDDGFGNDVSISGGTVLVGAYADDDGGWNSGSAYIFSSSNNVWTQQAKLTADDAWGVDLFGYSVAISGDTAVIGAKQDDDGASNAGSAYVFTSGSTPGSESITIDLPGGVPLEMVRIPAGSFMMGSEDSPDWSWCSPCEQPIHAVTIGNDFYIGKFEVTQGQWLAVMGSWPEFDPADFSYGHGDNYPAYYVSWYDCQNFIAELNQLGQGIFRLPTEAEWEYSCRSESTTRFCFGNSACNSRDCGNCELDDYAWWCSNSESSTHPVGEKAPNAYGLYDMHGNIFEWCNDYYSQDYYSSSPQINPAGPGSGDSRVLRGGSWNTSARNNRSSDRNRNAASGRYEFFGFRLVREATGTMVSTGTVSVDVTPDTGQWTLDGPSGFEGNSQTYTGDQTFSDAPVGEYTLTCLDSVVGYEPPAVQTMTLIAGASEEFIAEWVLIENGYIEGQWKGSGIGSEGQVDFDLYFFDGNILGTITEVGENEPPEEVSGNYNLDGIQITFELQEGEPYYTTWDYSGTVNNPISPSSMSGEIQGGPDGEEDFSLTLLRVGDVPSGSINVNVTPDTGQWTLDGPSGFGGNGQTYTGDKTFNNAPIGEYTLTCLDNVVGYDPPVSQIDSLLSGATLAFDADWILENAGGDEITINLPGGVTIEMVKIPAGTFMMGGDPGAYTRRADEYPQHQVNISYYFYMGKYEVTKAQWQAVMSTTPWAGKDYVIEYPDSPVVYVSWNEAQAFITELNQLSQGTFRLPSEAEWEYACRVGTETHFYWGGDPIYWDERSYSQIDDYAWWEGNARDANECYAHVVGQKLPNAFNLYDMSGNVSEWCQDYRHTDYNDAPNDGSAWESPSSSSRMLRGGNWRYYNGDCRSACRGWDNPGSVCSYIGFRIVRTR